jgi:hypothetical protein
MGWFSSKQEDNNKAYAEGHEAGKNADLIARFVHDIGKAVDSNFGPESTKDSSYNAGFSDGVSKK